MKAESGELQNISAFVTDRFEFISNIFTDGFLGTIEGSNQISELSDVFRPVCHFMIIF